MEASARKGFYKLANLLEHFQRLGDILLVQMPFHHARNAAVIKAILAARRAMQIQHHLQMVLLRP